VNKIPFSVYDFFGYLASGFLLLVALDYGVGGLGLLGQPPGLVVGLFWILVAYVLGHIVAHLSSTFLEEGVLRRVLGSPEDHLFEERKSGGWARLFPGNFKPFPKATQDRILQKAQRHSVPAPGRGFFFHCHPLVKRDQATLERLNSFLNLYGFCRNLSLALILAVPLLLYGALREFDYKTLQGINGDRLAWAAVALVASIGMFYRYLKFFRHYTVEVFMTYAELPN
jgi:hypothetical protein